MTGQPYAYRAHWHWQMSQSLVKPLPDKNADVTAIAHREETALHDAAASGNLEVPELLLDNHTPIEVKENSALTALPMATIYGNNEDLQLLFTQIQMSRKK